MCEILFDFQMEILGKELDLGVWALGQRSRQEIKNAIINIQILLKVLRFNKIIKGLVENILAKDT